MTCPVSSDALLAMHRELVARNGIEQGMIYLQVTRGACKRDHVFPKDIKPTVFVMAGGYGNDLEDTLQAQLTTWRVAWQYHQRWQNVRP